MKIPSGWSSDPQSSTSSPHVFYSGSKSILICFNHVKLLCIYEYYCLPPQIMTEWTSVFIEKICSWLLFFFFQKFYFLWAAQFKVSPLAMPSGHVVYVTLWTHTHTHVQTHTVSLNIGQLSMSAAGGLTLELDFYISSFYRIHTELPSGGVYYDVLKCISIVYMFIPPPSDERRMWDEICVWPDRWFT